MIPPARRSSFSELASTQDPRRKVCDCNGLLNTTVTVFRTFFTLHIATFQVGGVFAYKAFPPTVATVLCEPLRTFPADPAHCRTRQYTDFYRSESFRPLRRLRL